MKECILIHSDEYQNWVFSSSHPTQGRRFHNGRDLIVDAAKAQNISLEIMPPRLATRAELESVHSADYVSEVVDSFQSGQWSGADEQLAQLASTFVGGTLEALKVLVEGKTLTAIHLPGAKHHAQYDHDSGFCVFADLVIAAKQLVAAGQRVAVFDFDAHHGDGTENLTKSDDNILSYSVHHYGIFPGTGAVSEPEYHIYNKPLNALAGDDELAAAAHEFVELTKVFNADYIFVAAGADGHINDPLGGLAFTTAGAQEAMRIVRSSFPATPILMGGAGGYRPDDDTPAMWSSAFVGLTSGRSLLA